MIKTIHGYEFIEVIGKGAYGTVWKASKDGKEYAIKENISNKKGFRELKELDIMSRVTHKNIIKHFEFFISEPMKKIQKSYIVKSLYYVLPLADSDLKKYMKIKIDKGKLLSIDEQVMIVYEILSGYYYLHKIGVFHCDIKPANILMFGDKPVIADLGLAIYFTGPMDELCQSFSYSSPEALINLHGFKTNVNIPGVDKEYDYKGLETWAIGVLIAFISSGYNPFEKTTQGNIFSIMTKMEYNKYNFFEDNGIHPEWYELLSMLLETDFRKRIKTIEEMLVFDIFKKRQYSSPIEGEVVNYIPNNIVCEPYFNFLMIRTKKLCTYENFRIVTFTTAANIFYKINGYFPAKDMLIYLLTCVIISSKLHEGFLSIMKVTDYNEYVDDNEYSLEDYLKAEESILLKLKGVLNLPNIYHYSFSLDSLIKGIDFLLDCKKYTYIGPENFMIKLEDNETIKERQNRRSRNENMDIFTED